MTTILLFIFLFFIIWDAAWWLLGVKPLLPWQLKKKLDRRPSGLLLLDVRTPGEYGWFHLPESQNYPGLLFDAGPLRQVSADQPLVIICLTGHRSPVVAYSLKKKGFKQVYNLTWGMLGWRIYQLFNPKIPK